MGIIATTLGYLALDEITRLVNSAANDADREKIVSDILTKAEKQGSAMLTDALNKLNNIPSIASSPLLTMKIRDARKKATANYKNVEQAVHDLRNVASKAQTDINAISNRGATDKFFNKGKYQKFTDNVQTQATNAMNKIESDLKTDIPKM